MISRVLAIGGLVAILAMAAQPPAEAKVPADKLAELGGRLTCSGAEKAGSPDGVPEYTGKFKGSWPGMKGQYGFEPGPYAAEKPLFSINAQNAAQYADKLTEGEKRLFARYPQTYRMDVYPSHRDFAPPDWVCENTRKNAVSSEVVHDGKGVTGTADGTVIALGNAALLGEIQELTVLAQPYRDQGQTVVCLTLDDAPAGIIVVADPVKATTPAALKALAAEGLNVIMLTGDNTATARAVAASLGLTDVRADVLPDQKADVIEDLIRQGRKVAMAGDGVNDAPALAAATVGIAMGNGTDIAMESAGITLIRGDLGGIVKARALSRVVMRNIKQNLVFAFAYNTIGVPVAAGLLYPAFGLLLSPVIASAAMSLSSVSVIANALRIRAAKL